MGEAIATADRLGPWRDLIREHFVALDIRADDDAPFAGRVEAGTVGHLRVARVTSRSQEFRRTPALARHDGISYLQVGLLSRGSAVVGQDGRQTPLRAGQFALYETARPFRWELRGDWELLVLTWPRAGLALDEATSRGLTARPLGGSPGLGATVGRMLADVAVAPPALSAPGGVRLADELAELVTTVACEHADPAPAPRTGDDVLRRVQAYALEHLADPDLDPAALAAAHYVSTRHLHRLFAAHGTTSSRWVQQQRLDRCRRDLLDPRSDHRSVTEIARRWGWPDLTSFGRAFRRAYGVTPSEFRARRAR